MTVGRKPRCHAYVDGFNLYKGVLQRRPHLKWLNLISYLSSQVPDYELAQVFYFTAPVKELFLGDEAPRRQHRYIRVLENQGIRVVYGKFRSDRKWMRAVTPNRLEFLQPELPPFFGVTQRAIDSSFRRARPDSPKAQVLLVQEKGSDVNLGSYLLRDAYEGTTEAGLVVTGDSDLATPIRFATERGLLVKVLVPNKNQSVSSLRREASEVAHIRSSDLAQHQLPKTFVTAEGRQIVRPREWTTYESPA